MSAVEVAHPGPFATVQDLGRPGLGHLGVGRAGACDRGSLRLANRLVGNDEGAAAIEATAGGLVLRAIGAQTVALTGARVPAWIRGREVAPDTPLRLGDGADLRLGTPSHGLRTYVAVRGGIDLVPVLGSRSTDTLAGLGPPPLRAGGRLPVGLAPADWWPIDLAPVAIGTDDPLELHVRVGPRDDWFEPGSVDRLLGSTYEVKAASDRIGMQLTGPVLRAAGTTELASEGLVPGALQVPPSGQPTLMLADHPVTGGYVVIAVVVHADLDAAGQARPGQRLRFRVARPA